MLHLTNYLKNLHAQKIVLILIKIYLKIPTHYFLNYYIYLLLMNSYRVKSNFVWSEPCYLFLIWFLPSSVNLFATCKLENSNTPPLIIVKFLIWFLFELNRTTQSEITNYYWNKKYYVILKSLTSSVFPWMYYKYIHVGNGNWIIKGNIGSTILLFIIIVFECLFGLEFLLLLRSISSPEKWNI